MVVDADWVIFCLVDYIDLMMSQVNNRDADRGNNETSLVGSAQEDLLRTDTSIADYVELARAARVGRLSSASGGNGSREGEE